MHRSTGLVRVDTAEIDSDVLIAEIYQHVAKALCRLTLQEFLQYLDVSGFDLLVKVNQTRATTFTRYIIKSQHAVSTLATRASHA